MKQVVPNASWTRWQGPRAVWAGGSLFIGHAGLDGIYISQVDEAGDFQGQFRLLVADIDNHNVAAVGVRSDDRLLVAYSSHGDSVMRVRISINPLDVSSWGVEQQLTSGLTITYPNLWHLSSEGRWYLFFRSGPPPGQPPMFIVSDDDGQTWDDGSPTQLMTDNGERPYVKMDSNGVDRIDIALTDGHPNEVASENSVYHLYYQGGSWFTSDGTGLGTPPFSHASLTQVWDGSSVYGAPWDVHSGPRPRILFESRGDRRYRSATWDGSDWQLSDIAPSEEGAAGQCLDHTAPDRLYLSREGPSGQWEMESWTTQDGGLTWSLDQIITADTPAPLRNFRPAGARGEGPFAMVWLRGEHNGLDQPWTTGLYADLVDVEPPPDDPGGLPQVAQAVIRTRLTWLSCNLSDGALIEELPDLKGDEVSRVIGEYTSANLSLPIPSMDVPDTIPADERLAAQALLATKATEPRRTMIVCVINDVPTYAGIPLPRDLGTDADIPLGLVSLEGYLRHRYIGDHTYDEQDVALIADGILRDAGDTDDGQGIGLIIDAPNTGVIASRAYLDIDDQPVYDGLSELMDAGLIEWTVDVDWRDGFKYRIVDKIARVRSRLGRSGAPQTFFQSATFSSQGGSSASYLLKEDYSGDRYANVVRLSGAGEGVDQPRSAPAIDQAQLDAGVPVWELRDSAPQTVTQQALLDLHAERRLDRVRSGAQALEVVARWDAPGARYGVDWSMGDDVGHELKGHAHPSGLNGARRAIGFALSIRRSTIRPILQEDL